MSSSQRRRNERIPPLRTVRSRLDLHRTRVRAFRAVRRADSARLAAAHQQNVRVSISAQFPGRRSTHHERRPVAAASTADSAGLPKAHSGRVCAGICADGGRHGGPVGHPDR